MGECLATGILAGLALMVVGGLAVIVAGTGSGGVILLSGCLLYGLTLIAGAIERKG